jgi:hypothetical protein
VVFLNGSEFILVFIILGFISVLSLEINYQEGEGWYPINWINNGEGWYPINWINPAIFLALISNNILSQSFLVLIIW